MGSRPFLAALTGFALLFACLAGHAESLSIRLPNAGLLSISTERGQVRARVGPADAVAHAENVVVDSALAHELRGARELVAVGGHGFTQTDRTFFILAVARPSVAHPGSGYCGAGTEDFLVLAEWKARPRRLEWRDRLQVQSCLQEMELQSDQGNALRTVLGAIHDPAEFSLVWLSHPQFGAGAKSVAVVGGRFVISP